MGGGPESCCVNLAYGADGAVRLARIFCVRQIIEKK